MSNYLAILETKACLFLQKLYDGFEKWMNLIEDEWEMPVKR